VWQDAPWRDPRALEDTPRRMPFGTSRTGEEASDVRGHSPDLPESRSEQRGQQRQGDHKGPARIRVNVRSLRGRRTHPRSLADQLDVDGHVTRWDQPEIVGVERAGDIAHRDPVGRIDALQERIEPVCRVGRGAGRGLPCGA
jgi:hypothetical protein